MDHELGGAGQGSGQRVVVVGGCGNVEQEGVGVSKFWVTVPLLLSQKVAGLMMRKIAYL